MSFSVCTGLLWYTQTEISTFKIKSTLVWFYARDVKTGSLLKSHSEYWARNWVQEAYQQDLILQCVKCVLHKMLSVNCTSVPCVLFKVCRLYCSVFNIFCTWKSVLNQGLFCHDQVISGKFLEYFNLWHNLQMFLDTMEPRKENKNSSLAKIVLIMWPQMCGIIS